MYIRLSAEMLFQHFGLFRSTRILTLCQRFISKLRSRCHLELLIAFQNRDKFHSYLYRKFEGDIYVYINNRFNTIKGTVRILKLFKIT